MAQTDIAIPAISMRDVLRIFFKHRKAMVALYAVIVVVSALLCFFWPPTYEAAVSLLVTHNREEPVISSDQDSVRTLNKQSVTADDLNSEMSIIESPAVLEKHRARYAFRHVVRALVRASSERAIRHGPVGLRLLSFEVRCDAHGEERAKAGGQAHSYPRGKV